MTEPREVLSCNSEQNRRYIGDGVYVSWDGYYIKLDTEESLGDSIVILLENEVLNNMLRFIKDVYYTTEQFNKMKEVMEPDDDPRSDGDS